MGSRGTHLLKHQLVFPTVTEIVLVRHSIFRMVQHLVEPNLPLALSLYSKLWIGSAVEIPRGLKLMKMAVGPSHQNLQDIMKLQ